MYVNEALKTSHIMDKAELLIKNSLMISFLINIEDEIASTRTAS